MMLSPSAPRVWKRLIRDQRRTSPLGAQTKCLCSDRRIARASSLAIKRLAFDKTTPVNFNSGILVSNGRNLPGFRLFTRSG